jgi:hypothetical protein
MEVQFFQKKEPALLLYAEPFLACSTIAYQSSFQGPQTGLCPYSAAFPGAVVTFGAFVALIR